MSSYSTPPSLNTSSQPYSSSAAAHPSLPARPPAPNNPHPAAPPSFKTTSGAGRGYAPAVGFKPRSVAAPSTSATWQQSYSPTLSAGPAPPASYSAPSAPYKSEAGYDQGQYYAQSPMNYYPQQSGAQNAPPSLQNPFPAQGRGAGRGHGEDYDPELEAQIAQWQSAYVAKDETNAKPGTTSGNANYTPLGGRPTGNIDVGNATAPSTGVAAVVAGADGKQKTVVRSGGGKAWQDSSLLEWDPSHPRLFIGNIAGEVTDDSLLKAFSRYPSVQKARVIRDKRTSKSKGYGFVSFGSSDDYFQAAKEMQGKYIGSHPVLIKRSTTEIKASVPQPKGRGGKGHGGKFNLGADTGAGVQKKTKKKGGLKLLG